MSPTPASSPAGFLKVIKPELVVPTVAFRKSNLRFQPPELFGLRRYPATRAAGLVASNIYLVTATTFTGEGDREKIGLQLGRATAVHHCHLSREDRGP